MTIEELTLLLARIQVLDNRQVDALTIQAWTPLMADVAYEDAVKAVNEHFRTNTDYLQPAHITRQIAYERMLSLPQTMSPEVATDRCRHRWLSDGTCLFCTARRDDEEAER